MYAHSLTWILSGAAAVIVIALALTTMRTHRKVELDLADAGRSWKRAYHLGAELASGRHVEQNTARLAELFAGERDHLALASAIGVAVRQHADDVDDAIFVALTVTGLAASIRSTLQGGVVDLQMEALELVEVLHLDTLVGDAAVLTRSKVPGLARAACDAVVENDPAMGVGILIGLIESGGTWVLDALDRAGERMARQQLRSMPVARAQWADAPMLARRVLAESAQHDVATVNGAVSALISALDDASSAKRLTAVNALLSSIDHPAAQIALLAAVGSGDRMTRFATAAGLAESVIGRELLRRTAAHADGSDAARMAAEVLWSVGDESPPPLLTVVH